MIIQVEPSINHWLLCQGNTTLHSIALYCITMFPKLNHSSFHLQKVKTKDTRSTLIVTSNMFLLKTYKNLADVSVQKGSTTNLFLQFWEKFRIKHVHVRWNTFTEKNTKQIYFLRTYEFYDASRSLWLLLKLVHKTIRESKDFIPYFGKT